MATSTTNGNKRTDAGMSPPKGTLGDCWPLSLAFEAGFSDGDWGALLGQTETTALPVTEFASALDGKGRWF